MTLIFFIWTFLRGQSIDQHKTVDIVWKRQPRSWEFPKRKLTFSAACKLLLSPWRKKTEFQSHDPTFAARKCFCFQSIVKNFNFFFLLFWEKWTNELLELYHTFKFWTSFSNWNSMKWIGIRGCGHSRVWLLGSVYPSSLDLHLCGQPLPPLNRTCLLRAEVTWSWPVSNKALLPLWGRGRWDLREELPGKSSQRLKLKAAKKWAKILFGQPKVSRIF